VANPDNVLVPQTGSAVYVAPVGTAAPTTEAVALNAAFIDLGHIADDAPSISPSSETNEITDWLGVLVRATTTTTWSVSVPLLETTAEALKLAFGGGTLTTTASGMKFVPTELTQERAMVIHMVDGDFTYRFYFARVIVTEVGEVSPSSTDGTVWEITFTVAAPSSGDKIALFTDNEDLVDEATP
jgi:hypothetical protein